MYEPKSEKIRKNLDVLCEKLVFLDADRESRLKAELLIKFGLKPERAQQYIDALVISGRIQRIVKKGGDANGSKE